MKLYNQFNGKRRVVFTYTQCNKVLTWKFQVDESTAGRYNMIIGRDILTKLVIYLK